MVALLWFTGCLLIISVCTILGLLSHTFAPFYFISIVVIIAWTVVIMYIKEEGF